jgi:hypothetical protein
MNWKLYGSNQSRSTLKYIQIFAWGTEENHEKIQAGYPVSRLMFEHGTG